MTNAYSQTGQNRPPAGLESQLTHLPACNAVETPNTPDQVQQQGDGTFTRHFVTRADGVEITLRSLPSVPLEEAYSILSNAALCKVGGTTVPLNAPGDVVATAGTRLTLTPAVPQSEAPSMPLMGALALTAIIAIATIAGCAAYAIKAKEEPSHE